MRDFIERMQSKPEHERRRFALLSSAGITLVIAMGWLAALSTSNSFALAPVGSSLASFGETQGIGEIVQETTSGFENLLGAAGASGKAGAQTGTGLQVVDGESSSSLDRNTDVEERTVIPF